MSADPQESYDLTDLKNWQAVSANLDPKAKLAVFGDPVKHSRSPQMHNPALIEGGKNCQYIRFHIQAGELREALSLLGPKGFIGTNVTIPHKGDVFGAVDEMSEVAKLTRSVNTVLIGEDNQLIGHNTDAPGIEQAIREEFAVDLSDLRIMVLGAGGGAGRAACVQATLSRCQRLVLVNRTVPKAEALKNELAPYFSASDKLLGPVDRLTVIPHETKSLERELKHTDLIINATSLGMKMSDPALIPAHLIQPHHLVFDMVYAPPQTRLMRDAIKAGARAANGLTMLLWQGAYAYEFWFNDAAPVNAMRKGLLDSLAND